MTDNIRGLLAKVWKDEPIDLEPGLHCCDEVITVRVTGTVEKCEDELIAPTISIPLIPTIALFWEKCGITRDHALRMLREAVTEAMFDGVKEGDHIQSRIKDVDAAIRMLRTDLLDRLPKMRRSGKLITKGLTVTVTAAKDETVLAVA
jgi:hypothetical protein